MSAGKKKRPLSPAEIARRKEAAEKQALAFQGQDLKNPAHVAKGGGFVPPKSQMFRHQGR